MTDGRQLQTDPEPIEALAAVVDRLEGSELPLDEAATLASEAASVAADAAAALESAARLAARDDLAQTSLL